MAAHQHDQGTAGSCERWRLIRHPGQWQSELHRLPTQEDRRSAGAVDTDGVISAASGDRSLVQTFASQIVGVLSACAAMANATAPQAGRTTSPAPHGDPPAGEQLHGNPLRKSTRLGRPDAATSGTPTRPAMAWLLVGSRFSALSVRSVYRVVSADHPRSCPPGLREYRGDLLRSRLTDTAPLTRAVRYYDVGRTRGRTSRPSPLDQDFVAYGGGGVRRCRVRRRWAGR